MILELISELLKLTVLVGLTVAGVLTILIWKKNRTTKVTYLKFVVQIASLAAIYYLFTYPVKQLLILLFILVMPLVLGRFFCGWLCPFGLYMDVITLIRRAFKIRFRNLSEKLNNFLHKLRYVLFIVFLIIPFTLLLMDPLPTSALLPLMALSLAGPFRPLGVLLGPVVPLIVPWKGPLEIGGLYFSFPYIQEVIHYSSGIFVSINTLGFLTLIMVGSFFVRRFWCRFCPTGVSIAALNRFAPFKWAPILHLNKVEEKCTKCGICERVCPVQVTKVYEKKGGDVTSSKCMFCLRCIEMCPYEGCLELKFAGISIFKSRNWLEGFEKD